MFPSSLKPSKQHLWKVRGFLSVFRRLALPGTACKQLIPFRFVDGECPRCVGLQFLM